MTAHVEREAITGDIDGPAPGLIVVDGIDAVRVAILTPSHREHAEARARALDAGARHIPMNAFVPSVGEPPRLQTDEHTFEMTSGSDSAIPVGAHPCTGTVMVAPAIDGSSQAQSHDHESPGAPGGELPPPQAARSNSITPRCECSFTPAAPSRTRTTSSTALRRTRHRCSRRRSCTTAGRTWCSGIRSLPDSRSARCTRDSDNGDSSRTSALRDSWCRSCSRGCSLSHPGRRRSARRRSRSAPARCTPRRPGKGAGAPCRRRTRCSPRVRNTSRTASSNRRSSGNTRPACRPHTFRRGTSPSCWSRHMPRPRGGRSPRCRPAYA